MGAVRTPPCEPGCLVFREGDRPYSERAWTKMELIDELGRARAHHQLCQTRLSRIPKFVLWVFGAH